MYTVATTCPHCSPGKLLRPCSCLCHSRDAAASLVRCPDPKRSCCIRGLGGWVSGSKPFLVLCTKSCRVPCCMCQQPSLTGQLRMGFGLLSTPGQTSNECGERFSWKCCQPPLVAAGVPCVYMQAALGHGLPGQPFYGCLLACCCVMLGRSGAASSTGHTPCTRLAWAPAAGLAGAVSPQMMFGPSPMVFLSKCCSPAAAVCTRANGDGCGHTW